MDTNELRKAANCIFIATDEKTAQDISERLNAVADEIDMLRVKLSAVERSLGRDEDYRDMGRYRIRQHVITSEGIEG